jgi:DHA2 family multidrug resistance protein
LFGSVYLMPVFLAFVRGITTPSKSADHAGHRRRATADRADGGRWKARRSRVCLSAAGFALFALGLGCSAFQSRVADFDEMFWPQVLRGVAIMFCLLPPTRLALGTLAAIQVPDASGLFNLMRNLGGAIGSTPNPLTSAR